MAGLSRRLKIKKRRRDPDAALDCWIVGVIVDDQDRGKFRSKDLLVRMKPELFTREMLLCTRLHRQALVSKRWKMGGENRAQKLKKYLLLVAHPDDECMFFGPTLLSLTTRGGCELHVLCISNGVEQVPAENVTVLDHPSLQDGHRELWSQKLLVEIIGEAVESQAIECVITFDRYGVSGHPNHCALSQALRAYLAKRSNGCMEDGQIEGWELESVNIARKYSGVLEIFVSTLKWLLSRKGDCFVTPNPLTSMAAMKQHKSQRLWYRRLFVVFASYTYVNTLRRIPALGDELVRKHD